MISVCCPVLKRYDLLRGMLLSLCESELEPNAAYVLDNGRNEAAVNLATNCCPFPVIVWTPAKAMGVAESWNWFIKNVPEERLIVNDDVLFAPQSLEDIIETPGDFVSPLLGQAYSCFLLRNSCVSKIGKFDETISPGYAYFEDCDYSERMVEAGFRITHLECGVTHLGSQTLAVRSSDEMQEHHRKFMIAQENFVRKWGHMPENKVRQTAKFSQPVLE